MMRRWAVRVGLWLARWGGWTPTPVCQLPHVPQFDADLLEVARTLCRESEAMPASGESKRHRVYALLLKHYPGVSKRTVAFAIECALAE